MPLVTWDETYSVGNATIDKDHRQIAELLNDLYEAEVAGHADHVLSGIFDQIVQYTREHFYREEKLLEARNYPRIEEQKAEHKLLKDMLKGLRSRFDTGQNADRVANDVREFLLTWWMGHILEEDMKYKSVLSDTIELS